MIKKLCVLLCLVSWAAYGADTGALAPKGDINLDTGRHYRIYGSPLSASDVGAEPAITAGNSSQYWRGDKTWQNLPASGIGGSTGSTDNALLRADGTGGVTAQNSLVTVDDNGSVNIPSGQSYKINGTALAATDVGSEPAITAGTTAQYWRGDKTWQTLNQAAVDGLKTSDSPTFAGATITGGLQVDSPTLYVDAANNRVGIGKNAPATTLHLNTSGTAETVRITQDNSARYLSLNTYSVTATGTELVLGSSSTYDVQVIAGETGGVYLDAGATAWASLSDKNLKTDIEPVVDALAKIALLKPSKFRLTTDSKNKGKRIGLMAQDVQAAVPEAVASNKDGTLGYRPTELIPLLVKATQEQQEQIEALKTRVEALEKKAK